MNNIILYNLNIIPRSNKEPFTKLKNFDTVFDDAWNTYAIHMNDLLHQLTKDDIDTTIQLGFTFIYEGIKTVCLYSISIND